MGSLCEKSKRVFALTRLTLRVGDADNGGARTILLPPGARSWYVRADATRSRAYNARLGYTLPSGEFREIAQSNTVVTPRVGPSPEAASARKRVGAPPGAPGVAAAADPWAPGPADEPAVPVEPWRPVPEHSDALATEETPAGPGRQAAPKRRGSKGGASDAFTPGGASDTYRR